MFQRVTRIVVPALSNVRVQRKCQVETAQLSNMGFLTCVCVGKLPYQHALMNMKIVLFESATCSLSINLSDQFLGL